MQNTQIYTLAIRSNTHYLTGIILEIPKITYSISVNNNFSDKIKELENIIYAKLGNYLIKQKIAGVSCKKDFLADIISDKLYSKIKQDYNFSYIKQDYNYLIPIMFSMEDFINTNGLWITKNKYEFEILGDPQGKDRPRVGKVRIIGYKLIKNKKIPIYRPAIYSSKKTNTYEHLVRAAAKNSVNIMDRNNSEIITDPLKITIYSNYSLNKSLTKKDIIDCLIGINIPVKKPDIDNIAKIILDGINPLTQKHKIIEQGIIADDKQVVQLHCYKAYFKTAKTKVVIEELKKIGKL